MKLPFLLPLVAATYLLAQATPQRALHHFQAANGLEVKLWASEPMFENPTNIDIDERGHLGARSCELPPQAASY